MLPPNQSPLLNRSFFAIFQTLVGFLLGSAVAQEAGGNPNDNIRRLRFRRPRPKLANIDNEDGVGAGQPIPLRAIPQGKNLASDCYFNLG